MKEGYEVLFCGRNESEGAKISNDANATFIKVVQAEIRINPHKMF